MTKSENINEDDIEGNNKVIAIVSGGADSISFAAYLKKLGYELKFVYFNYGQLAQQQEKQVVEQFADILTPTKDFMEIDITKMELFGTHNILTNPDNRNLHKKEFTSNVLVPLRNGVFLTLMSAYAKANDYKYVSFGAHLTDASHYPDCTAEFITHLEVALNLGYPQKETEILSPVLYKLDKTQLLKKGYEVLGNQLFGTISCYRPMTMGTNSVWWHCGTCASCVERQQAFKAAGLKDKTSYDTF